MLLKNNINLNLLVESARSNDSRAKTDWIAGKNRFISNYSYPAFPVTPFITDFLKNGSDTNNFAPIGTRPNCNLRLSLTTPGQYYIIKFSDKSVRVTQNNIAYTSTPEGTIIGTAKEDLKFLILELQGAGGGGCGGGSIFSGTGGASGGYLLGLLNLEHEAGANWGKNSLPLRVGTGGSGVRDRNQAGNGEDTGFWISNSLALCAAGGNGADAGDPGSPRTAVIAGVDSIFYTFRIIQGRDGHAGNGHDNSGPYTFSGLGPSEENTSITYPSFSSGSGTVYGGDGGNSVMAAGGYCPSGRGKNGTDGTGPGAGGGGGSGAPISTGGNGANGLINIYY